MYLMEPEGFTLTANPFSFVSRMKNGTDFGHTFSIVLVVILVTSTPFSGRWLVDEMTEFRGSAVRGVLLAHSLVSSVLGSKYPCEMHQNHLVTSEVST